MFAKAHQTKALRKIIQFSMNSFKTDSSFTMSEFNSPLEFDILKVFVSFCNFPSRILWKFFQLIQCGKLPNGKTFCQSPIEKSFSNKVPIAQGVGRKSQCGVKKKEKIKEECGITWAFDNAFPITRMKSFPHVYHNWKLGNDEENDNVSDKQCISALIVVRPR